MHQEEFTVLAAGAHCHAYVCYNTSVSAKKPAVIIVHAFEGQTDEYRRQAQEIAKQGYVGIAIDMYGGRQTATDLEGCLALMSSVTDDRALCRQRLLETYDWIKTLDCVDPKRIGIIGYCFGGLCALDLARAGAPIQATISVHGSFAAPDLECQISSKVLILHGYNDPLTPFSDFTGLATELDSYGCDWQAHFYSQTKHAFTDPVADKIGPPELGREYNPISCQRAWQSCLNLFAEIF